MPRYMDNLTTSESSVRAQASRLLSHIVGDNLKLWLQPKNQKRHTHTHRLLCLLCASAFGLQPQS